MNRRYLKKFILDPRQHSEARVHRDAPKTSRPKGQATQALFHYRELNAIFGFSLIEGTTVKERAIYVNMARRMVLTGPPLTLTRLITFSDANTDVVLFPHNDALVVSMHIEKCECPRSSSTPAATSKILYGGSLDRMEDTLEMACTMINPQIWSYL